MAYRKPGYYLKQYGAYIQGDAYRTATAPNWEANLAEAVKSIGREARPLSSITVEDIYQINTPAFPTNSEQHTRLIRLLLTILHKAGIISRSPVIPVYTRTPELTFSEVLDYMMTEKIPWPTLEHFGGQEARLETFRSLLPVVMRNIAFSAEFRRILRDNLEERLKDIGFRIFNRIPIDQAEKSFYLAFCNPASRPTRPRKDGKELAGPEIKGQILPALQNDRPAVLETWELYKKSVQPGPALNYARLISNANLESLIAYFGPHAASLPFCIGYLRPAGPFMEPALQRLDEITWSDIDVLTALREKSGFFVHSGPAYALRGPVLWPQTTSLHLDLPNVNIYRTSERDISLYEWDYFSSWRQRIVMSSEGADENTLLTDLAVTNKALGGGQIDSLNIDHLDLVDMSEIPTDKRVRFDTDRLTERTLVPAQSGGRTLEVKQVDMSDFYIQRGREGFIPAFTEYVMPPRSWYMRQDPAAVQYIMSRVGGNLTLEDRNRLTMSTAIMHNAEHLKRLLGRDADFNVARFIANLTGCKVSEETAADFEPKVSQNK